MPPSRSSLRGPAARRSDALDRWRETRQDSGNPARSALPLRHVETNRSGSFGVAWRRLALDWQRPTRCWCADADVKHRIRTLCDRSVVPEHALALARNAQPHERRRCHAFTSLVRSAPAHGRAAPVDEQRWMASRARGAIRPGLGLASTSETARGAFEVVAYRYLVPFFDC